MLKTLTLLSVALLTTQVSYSALAQDASSDEAIQPPVSTSVEVVDDSNHFQTAFLRRQVDQTMSVGRAISSIALTNTGKSFLLLFLRNPLLLKRLYSWLLRKK